jgi:thiol-disulfide isomerase/thioredoxin
MPTGTVGLVRGMSGTGPAVLAVALVLSAAASWWLRTRDGRLRTVQDGTVQQEEEGVGGPTAVLEGLGVRPADADLTVVQFSTAFCGPCRTTRARLQHLQATRPGLAYVHVDAESHLEAVRELDVRRTPTLFYLDREGRLLGRSSGAPRPEELTAVVDAHTGARS